MYELGKNVDARFKKLIRSYPDKLLELNGIKNLDPFELSERYYSSASIADISIDPNANIGNKSPVNYESEIFKPIKKLHGLYTMWKMVGEYYGITKANQAIKAIIEGKLYFHDLTKCDVPYCFAPDSSFWMHEGRPYGWLPGGPPKKLKSFLGQTVEVAMDMSQEHAGAIGIANVLVNAAYYTYKDKEQIKRAVDLFLYEEIREEVILEVFARVFSHNEADFIKKYGTILDIFKIDQTEEALEKAVMYLYHKEVEDCLQQLVHVLHNCFRIGGDAPFTNLSLFCRETIKRTFAEMTYPDGTKPEDIIDEIMEIQRIFARFFAEGSPITGKGYRFPVCTVNVFAIDRKNFTAEQKKKYPNKKKLVIDKEFLTEMAELNAKRGCFNFHQGEKLASCCRLTSDLAELRKQIRMDSFGNGGLSIGSHRVVTLNLHGIACEAKDTNKPFFNLHRKYMELAEMLLVAHKKWLEYIISTGTLKFFQLKWQDLKMFFSTIGYTGLWDSYYVDNNGDLEAYTLYSDTVLKKMDAFSKAAGRRNKGFAFNVEEAPAEGASPKLAAIDNYLYGDREWYKPVELLSNQMVPLYEDCDCFDRLQVMGDLMNEVSGGAICHFNSDGSLTPEASVRLTFMMIEEYDIPHFAIEIGSTTCVRGHTNPGIHIECPDCGGEIDTWTRRVVGFNTDTKDWNSVRRDWENLRRKVYSLDDLKFN